MNSAPLDTTPAAVPAPPRPDGRFLRAHPAHAIALGFGAGLSPLAPGTVGTLWGWLSFLVLDRWLDDAQWAVLLVVAAALGLWACTVTARHLLAADPGAIVWDEVLAFWLVLWLVMPTGFAGQLAAFVLFRFFDAVKPGPVGWADRRFKQPPVLAHVGTGGAEVGHRGGIGWVHGLGILLDDAVAALCTLLVVALSRVLAA